MSYIESDEQQMLRLLGEHGDAMRALDASPGLDALRQDPRVRTRHVDQHGVEAVVLAIP